MMPAAFLAVAIAASLVSLPAEFSGGRILLTPTVAATRVRLHLWMDTDGSGFLPESLVRKLGLRAFSVRHRSMAMRVAQLPALASRFPEPLGLKGGIPEVHLGKDQLADPLFRGIDGQVGASWFQERVWSIDYVSHRVQWFPDGRAPRHDPALEVPFSFVRSAGASLDGSEYPLVSVAIDGVRLSMSLDTGASVALSKTTLNTLNDGLPAVRGASFVLRDVAGAWHRKHPRWRYVANAGQTGGVDLIQVPLVRLGGVALSNVWFSTRPHDDVFEGDAVAGKLGGTAFVGKMLILDYPKRIAVVSSSNRLSRDAYRASPRVGS